jgi:hypothetical protein
VNGGSKKTQRHFEYLEGVARPINIRRLIDQYRAAVNEFAEWLLNRE